MKMLTRKIGGHVSAAGGVDKALERAKAIGANCVQVFSGSPRVWARPKLENFDAAKITSKKQELDVQPIFTHALYLLNLASDNPELTKKSTDAISYDLKFDAHIGGAGVVVHVGSHQGRGWAAVRDQVAKLIGETLASSPPNSKFLIENAASQNGKIGGDLEEIRWLLDEVSSEQLGWCFDTCHGFAGGYTLGKTPDKHPAEPENAEKYTALEEIERLQLWDELYCIHVNDSRDPFGSGRDRHDNIGDGLIPIEDLKYFLNHNLINDKPLILEVPGVEKEGPDAENIQRVQKLVTSG
jgi:deoxyribonuclease-4